MTATCFSTIPLSSSLLLDGFVGHNIPLPSRVVGDGAKIADYQNNNNWSRETTQLLGRSFLCFDSTMIQDGS